MKKEIILMSASLALFFTACNSDNKNNTTSDTTVTKTVNTDNGTSTTTTVVTHRLENKKLVRLGEGKPIILRYDTVHYYYVDASTNEQPKGYYFDPETKDTFDYRGFNVNNALVNNNGDYTVDESRIANDEYNNEVRSYTKAAEDMPGKIKIKEEGLKIKQTENVYKEKTDTSKIKITGNKMKVKIKKAD